MPIQPELPIRLLLEEFRIRSELRRRRIERDSEILFAIHSSLSGHGPPVDWEKLFHEEKADLEWASQEFARLCRGQLDMGRPR